MTEPISTKGIQWQLDTLKTIYDQLSRHIEYGRSLVGQNDLIPHVETTLLENAQAHIREATVSLARIKLNRIGDV